MASVEWKEKQLLMSSDVDSSEIEAGYDEKVPFPAERPNAGPRLLKAATAIVIGCAVGFLFVQIASRAFLRSHFAGGDGVFKVSTEFRGTDDLKVQQHVTSVVSDNYVMYHVVKPQESAWVVDDFEKSLQIMKIESEAEGRVCFVAHLNRSHSMTPDLYGLQSAESADDAATERVQRTFYADEMQLEELYHLGDRAVELCTGIPTFWIFPISDKMPNTVQNESKHRDKRNVKKCMTSCCTMVCCCNQRYLQWQQGGQKINCHNVCQGCSPKSKTNDIRIKVC